MCFQEHVRSQRLETRERDGTLENKTFKQKQRSRCFQIIYSRIITRK